MKRARRLLLAALVLLVLVIGGGFAVFAIRGADAPPPPALSGAPPRAEPTPLPRGGTAREVAQPSFVGYRVREKYVTVGVVDAVGRTTAVTGTATIGDNKVLDAQVTADMTMLRSDESRRDSALQGRAIETAAYPTSRFTLTERFPIRRAKTQARGRLTLHGRTRPITATVQGQRLDANTLELVGRAQIDFEAFAIEPPSVAGFVTVEDHGTLEFKLRLTVR